MLSAEQVIPFLSDDDPILREHAVRYFSQAYDIGPLTADHCWAAINQIGVSRAADDLIGLLAEAPQSDESTGELLAALDACDEPSTRACLLDALDKIEFEQLRRHRDRIFGRADLREDTVSHLQARLDLAELPADVLWQQLDEHARASNERYWFGDNLIIAARLVEALARHDCGERALAVLNDPATKDHIREVYAIEIVARLRYRPALELLLQRLVEVEEGDDLLYSALAGALPMIGGVDLIAPIEAIFIDTPWPFQIYAAEALGSVRHADAEAALIRLLDDPELEEERDHVAAALVRLCTTHALPQLKQIVLDGDYDDSISDLKEDLVSCALMAGFDFPELSAMREEVIADDAEFRRQLERGEFPLDQMGDDLGEEDFDDEHDDDDDYGPYPAPPADLDHREPEPIAPIRNTQPKIGRNDPCPCGSGKKYKKCCLNKG